MAPFKPAIFPLTAQGDLFQNVMPVSQTQGLIETRRCAVSS